MYKNRIEIYIKNNEVLKIEFDYNNGWSHDTYISYTKNTGAVNVASNEYDKINKLHILFNKLIKKDINLLEYIAKYKKYDNTFIY